MTRLSKILIGSFVLFFSIAACGLGGSTGTTPGAGSSGSNPPASGGSGPSSAGYGTVSLPASTVDLKAGQVYQIGQAIKDPKSGAIFEVVSVHKDGSLPGLNAGETYLMVDIILGNAGSQTFTSSSLASYLVKAKSDGKGYGEGHILALLAAQAIPSNAGMDTDVAPGTGFHGILPVVLSTTATGLTITFTPALDAGLGTPFTVDLGQ